MVVTPDVPYRNGGPAYAGNDPNGNIDAYQLYEKAIAQSRGEITLNGKGGPYDNEDGGWPQDDMPYITGQGASSTPAANATADQIQQALAHHQPVTVTTDLTGKDNSSVYDSSQSQYLIRGHVFYVTAIDTSAHPPTVTLVNPWGADSTGCGTVTLPLSQVQQHTDSVQIGD